MSHFVAIVIGPDHEAQLAPYSENLKVTPYISETAEEVLDLLKKAVKYFTELDADDKNFQRERQLALTPLDQLSNEDKLVLLDAFSGGDFRVENGQIVRYSTYNPKSKWDWFDVGGRWSGFFRTKPGVDAPVSGRTDQARKGDIDFEGMRLDAATEAAERFQKLVDLTQGLTPPSESWKDIVARVEKELGYDPDLDNSEYLLKELRDRLAELRNERNATPWSQALRSDDEFKFLWGDPYEEFFLGSADPAQAYIQSRVNSVYIPYAVVHNGEWFERGEMGWWGISSNEIDRDEWTKRVAELFDSLNDDTLLTVVDLHI